MKRVAVVALDGRDFYYAFLAGAKNVIKDQLSINLINVFPVKDHDTGTNLASTIQSVIEQVKPSKSYKTITAHIAKAALLGARGNSGVIFSQFLYGIDQETKNHDKITLLDFTKSMKDAVQYIYEAVATPVEGTMLTVIREWAHYIYHKRDYYKDFREMLIDSYEILKVSLEETKSKLKALEASNVVDAGAKGFVVFIEGIIHFLSSPSLKHLLSLTFTKSEIAEPELLTHEDATSSAPYFRYCTEAILKNARINRQALQALLQNHGDSVVIAGADEHLRFHLHTNQPAILFHHLKDVGNIRQQKVDDMIRQNSLVHDRKWKIAIVTDSSCDLPEGLLEKYQINVLPLGMNFKDTEYLDKVTITPSQVYSLLDHQASDYPKTSQVNEQACRKLYSELALHYDQIIALHLSSLFSGTYLSSKRAAEKVSAESGKEIYVFDTKNISGSIGLLVLRLACAIEDGHSFKELLSLLPTWIDRTKIFVSVKTLKYMLRSGRVSWSKAFLATLLNIKPIVSMDGHGKSMLFGTTFSQHGNMKKVIRHIEKLTKQQKIWNYIILHAHNEEGANHYAHRMKDLLKKDPISIVDISPAIGISAGLGSTAVALLVD
ncbi:MAG: DegV family EDD domain-containing protein [Oligoflexia bacterium]|nr:DegV family EDD domain-containing protein [Oligoflexia bacterium]MBF0367513.1 DegV family EDD domain-containing protein [Oligoflexia bacterium]